MADSNLTHTFLFHGTGTSSSLPLVPCITQSENIAELQCRCCRECIDPDVEEGWKNIRGNTGGVLRKKGRDGKWRTIVIDVGKTFTHQAVKLFRKHKITSIDAVILTHGHADAMSGLDDLRAFTANPPNPHTPPAASSYTSTSSDPPPPPPPKKTISIYLSRTTYREVSGRFPYLVDVSQATGGGDLPSLEWKVFEDRMEDEEGLQGEEGLMDGQGGRGFWIGGEGEGVWTIPYTVAHGKYFTPPSDLKPTSKPRDPCVPLSFPCDGFVFDGSIVYLGDVSFVPGRAWRVIMNAVGASSTSPPTITADSTHPRASTANLIDTSTHALPQPNHIPILILDSLRLQPHTSHISFLQALHLSSIFAAQRTYLIGFTHPVAHSEWLAGCKEVEGSRVQGDEDLFMGAVQRSVEKQDGEEVWKEVRRWGGYVRPAYDGQLLGVTESGLAVELEGSGPH